MIGKAPRWIPIGVGLISILWIVPLLGIVITSIRPAADTVLGWWQLDHIELTLHAWSTVWSKYPLASGFVVSAELAGIATIGSMILTPAGKCRAARIRTRRFEVTTRTAFQIRPALTIQRAPAP